ncbi:META domain-containing protein [Aliiruegeria sabulilitoris]|uniref:META domain-containing protein n=1 Tax=Aliiruegeria sabulilitoris TaxID=1510458 RepID=UPI00082997BA|nr:META domain-containing protein [Aliiruegeria sabulilitoris]NDR57385.1 META domain-containing protein [Pseudoruegeria sp. M32A2M]
MSDLCRIAGAIGLAAAACLSPTAGRASDWTIVSVNGTAATGQPQITLGADGTIAGNTGCNSFTGSARFENAMLVVEAPLAVTRMACPGDDLTRQEAAILQLLEGETAFTHDPFTGAFNLSRGEDQMALAELAASVFDIDFVTVDGLSGPLNIRQAPGTDAPLVTRVLPGTLLRNQGCEVGDTYDWCNITFLDASGTTGWAATEYLRPAPAAVRAQQGLFDNIGTLDCRGSVKGEVALCDYGVARDGDHSAVLVIYDPDGGERVVHFAEGELAYAETAEGTASDAQDSELSGDLLVVTLGQQTYEVPQTVIVGNGE